MSSFNNNGGDLVIITLYLLDWYDTKEGINDVLKFLK